MIDTHAHLYADAFQNDIEEVIVRAKEVGIEKILLPNIDLASIGQMEALKQRDTNLFQKMYGLHPCSVDESYKEVLEEIKKELGKNDFVAIGEIGIDLYWDKSTQKIQEEAFLEQCEWAMAHQVPIAIHSRESTDLLIDLLKSHFNGKLNGVFHCFVGDSKQAETIVDMGFYLGIGGVVTFKNSNLRNELVNIPIDRLLLETDAPYLAPMPYRGKRNESAYVIQVAEELSRIFDVHLETIIAATTQNALNLFNL